MKTWYIFFAALAIAAVAADNFPRRAAVPANTPQAFDLRSSEPISFYTSNGQITATVVITPNGPPPK